jgi:GNAT superfamily N-acetyltransferase
MPCGSAATDELDGPPRSLLEMSEASIEPFAPAHRDGVIALLAAEGWSEYTDDVERTYRALSAPGVTTLVANAGGRVVGAIQVQSDGAVQAHVSMLLIDAACRGRGLGSPLLREALDRAGGLYLDIRAHGCEPLARVPPHARESRARESAPLEQNHERGAWYCASLTCSSSPRSNRDRSGAARTWSARRAASAGRVAPHGRQLSRHGPYRGQCPDWLARLTAAAVTAF